MNINTSGKNAYHRGFLGKLFTQAQENFPTFSTDWIESKALNTEDDEQSLINCIRSSIRDWENANINFENADEEELIDYYSYQIKAAEVKYQYLLRLIKEKGINSEKLCLPSLTTKTR